MPVHTEETPALKRFRALTHTMNNIPPGYRCQVLTQVLDSIEGDEEWALIVQSFPSIREPDTLAATGNHFL